MSPLHRSSRLLLCSLIMVAATGCHHRSGALATNSSTGTWADGAKASAKATETPSREARGGAASEGRPAGPLPAATSSGVSRPAENLPTSRIEDLFAGRFAGLDVQRVSNGGISMRLRGVEPLLVIDGLEADPDMLGSIPPRSVLRIEVLRNVSETALYGSRGLNGVVLLTTRR
jgi:outer membrane receptor protein involved in Fe transport